MAEEEKEEKKDQSAKKSNNKLLMIVVIILAVLILAIGGLGVALLLGGNDEQVSAQGVQNQSMQQNPNRPTAKRSENLLTIGPMYPMDQFVVNLLSENGTRFLKVSLDIELAHEKLSAEMDMKKPAIRDIIIRTLSSKTFEEISTMKGKERLKDELVDNINRILADGQIKNIFFTDFVVQ